MSALDRAVKRFGVQPARVYCSCCGKRWRRQKGIRQPACECSGNRRCSVCQRCREHCRCDEPILKYRTVVGKIAGGGARVTFVSHSVPGTELIHYHAHVGRIAFDFLFDEYEQRCKELQDGGADSRTGVSDGGESRASLPDAGVAQDPTSTGRRLRGKDDPGAGERGGIPGRRSI